MKPATPQQRQLAIDLYASGLTFTEVAERTGFHSSSISAWWKASGRTRPAPKPPLPRPTLPKVFKPIATVVWGDEQMEEMMSHAPTFKGRE